MPEPVAVAPNVVAIRGIQMEAENIPLTIYAAGRGRAANSVGLITQVNGRVAWVSLTSMPAVTSTRRTAGELEWTIMKPALGWRKPGSSSARRIRTRNLRIKPDAGIGEGSTRQSSDVRKRGSANETH